MAVEDQVDVGALIAESIDNYYQELAPPDWFADYLVKAEAILAEAKASASDEQQLHEASDPLYRRGYKAGWKHARDQVKRGEQPKADPGDRTAEEYKGYMAGHEASVGGHEIIGHHKAGDSEAASMATMQHVVARHYDYGNRPQAGVNPQDWEQSFADWYGKPGAKGHPQSVEHSAMLINAINAGLDKDIPDEAHGRRADKGEHPHPADFHSIIQDMIRKRASFEGARRLGGPGQEPEEGPEVAAPEQEKPDPVQQAHASEELTRLALGSGYDDHMAEGKGHLDRQGAIDAFQQRALDRLEKLNQENHSGLGDKILKRKDGSTVTLNLGDYLKSRLETKGAVNKEGDYVPGMLRRGAGASYLKTKIPDFHSGKHELQGQINGYTKRAMDLLYRHSDSFIRPNEPREAFAARAHEHINRLKDSDPPEPGDEGARARWEALRPQEITAPDGSKIMFDPHKYLLDVAATGKKTSSIAAQIPGWNNKPDHPLFDQLCGHHRKCNHGITGAAEAAFRHSPDFHAEHPAWKGFSKRLLGKHIPGGHRRRTPEELAARTELAKKRRAEREQAAAEAAKGAIEASISVFTNWLNDNVQIPEGAMPGIMDGLYSKIEATYGVLFEGEED
jgi:hypothetical protein